MNRRLFNFFVISALCAVIFSACGHKPNLDGGSTPLITPKPVKVTWSIDGGGAENPKASVKKSTNGIYLSSGDEAYTGTELLLAAANDSTTWYMYTIDRIKTKINGKTVAELGKAIADFTSYGQIKYTIPQDASAVHIEFVLKQADNLQVEWKSKNPSDGEIKRWVKNDPPDNPVYDTELNGNFLEGKTLWFYAFPKPEKIVKNWYINGKAQNNVEIEFGYNVQKTDFVDGKILIEVEFGDKETEIPVYWKSLDETKGTVYAGRRINGRWTNFDSGEKFEEGYFFYVNAEVKPGFISDKWYINGEEVPATNINQLRYTVASKDIKGGKIEISVSFKEAPKIKVEWSVDETDKGSIRAEQLINNKWTEVQSGNLFGQSSEIRVIVEPKEGFAPDTWYINGNKAEEGTEGELDFWYEVDINDIVNDSIKIIHKFKPAEKINMEFTTGGSGKISVHNPKTDAIITDTQINEGTELRIKAFPFLGFKFKQFEHNGTKINSWNWGNGAYTANYMVKGKDKDKDTGKITIKAIFETDPDAPQGTIPVEFSVASGHEGNGIIIAKFKEKEFASGYKFKERDDVVFYALPKAGYQAKWFVNGNEHRTGNRIWLRVDNPFIGGDGKVSVKVQFVHADSVTVNFSKEGQGSVKAKKLLGDEWLTINSGDTVYEGTDISFEIEEAGSNMADWLINGKEAVDEIDWGGSLYFNITDYNESGLCTVKASFRKAKTYPVSFKIAEGGEGKGSLSIRYWDIVTKKWETSQEQNIFLKEGSSNLRFMVRLNNSAQVEKWTINGEEEMDTSADFWFGTLHKSKLKGKDKLEVVVHLK